MAWPLLNDSLGPRCLLPVPTQVQWIFCLPHVPLHVHLPVISWTNIANTVMGQHCLLDDLLPHDLSNHPTKAQGNDYMHPIPSKA